MWKSAPVVVAGVMLCSPMAAAQFTRQEIITIQYVGYDAITKYFEIAFAALPMRKVVLGEHAIRFFESTAVGSGGYDFQFTREGW